MTTDMALTYSQTIPFGQKAPDFSLTGIDGKAHSLADFRNKKAIVIIFMCNHCPYVQACWDRLTATAEKFGARGVQLIGINSNDAGTYPEDSFEKMKEYATAKKQNFPYLCDSTQEVAKKYGAVCTPDIFVYDEKQELVYHGRIDDNWKDPEKVNAHELEEAIKAVLDGRHPDQIQNPSMGCSIKWKE